MVTMYLEKLTNLNGISGFESDVREYIKEEIAGFATELREDFIGNLVAFVPGKRHDFKLAVFAHTDEVGLMITRVNDDGTLKFAPVGGVDPRVLVGKSVVVGQDVKGVIGFKPIHLQNRDNSEKPSFDNLSIFVGKGAKEVDLGDPVHFVTKFEEYEKFYVGKAFDDRAGCSVLMETMKSIREFPCDTYFVFATQEEIGLRGSGVAAANIQPDAALVVEGTTAGDNPELEKEHWSTHLGDGPAIVAAHSGYVIDSKIYEKLIETAKSNSIPYQMKRRIAGGTDAARIARSGRGAPVGVVAVPSRYIHSPVSVISREDYGNTLKLVKAFVESGVVLS